MSDSCAARSLLRRGRGGLAGGVIAPFTLALLFEELDLDLAADRDVVQMPLPAGDVGVKDFRLIGSGRVQSRAGSSDLLL